MQSWLRNVLLISTAVLLWAAVMFGVLSSQHQSILNSEQWVEHSYEVVNVSKDLEADVATIISKQRGYIISGDENFLSEYQNEKEEVLTTIIRIAALTQDSESQQEHILKLQSDFVAFTDLLDTRLRLARNLDRSQLLLADTSEVQRLITDLQTTMAHLLTTETRYLEARIKEEEVRKGNYALILYGGIGFSILLIIGLNYALLRINSRRESAEKENREMQDRFALAMKSTSDGVFDWDIENNSIYFSPRFKQMLGYRDEEMENSLESMNKLIHPDDFDSVWAYVNQYLKSQLSEYSQVYRAQHKNGGWVWLNSRGRAVFNKDGKAIRLIGAHTDITPIKEIEEKAKREKDTAVSANKAKSEFLANMSHEIRTPLNSIVGVSNILAKSKKLDEEQRDKLIRTLQNSSISLMDLINDVLDFAKIESGELKIEKRDFDLAPLMEQIISIMAVKANEKGLTFRVDYDELTLDSHYGDELRIRQILLNLIGNAIKFTDKGSVVVTARHEQGNLVVEVMDTGIGITDEVQEKLFRKFEQGDSSTSRKFGGTGLGLAISRQLAEMMDGTITLRSSVGKGSTFTLTLPVKAQDAGAAHIKPRPRTVPQGDFKGKILIAEDYEGNIVVIRFLLENMGIDYDIANNGAEAVRMYQASPYPLVMMDVQMPEMDGFEATRGIRHFEREQGLEPCTIIAMTAHALAGDSERCIAAGMNDYLSKPLMEADMKEKFAQYLFKTA